MWRKQKAYKNALDDVTRSVPGVFSRSSGPPIQFSKSVGPNSLGTQESATWGPAPYIMR